MIALSSRAKSINDYESPDYRVQEAILRRCLNGSSYKALRFVGCYSNGQEITLYGRVPSYFLKQMAQETARQALHPLRVVNLLVVGPMQATRESWLLPAGRNPQCLSLVERLVSESGSAPVSSSRWSKSTVTE